MKSSTNFLDCDGKYYNPKEITKVLEEMKNELKVVKKNDKTEFFNVASSLDIETSSCYSYDKKFAIMYEWTFGIHGKCFIGRTWQELIMLLNKVSNILYLDKNRRLIVYCHNLSFEFQFIRKWLEWDKIFSMDKRKPLYALSTIGIEFRCSYFLTGYKLETVGKNLSKYKVKKMTGDLDYSKIRHSKTPLTDEEIMYCLNDVRVVMAEIQERIERDGDITKIPLTKTGYVRNYCRNSCYYNGSHKKNTQKYHKYRKLMQNLTLSNDEYNLLKRAFMGGFTHASAWWSNKILSDIVSWDFTSSYPAVLVMEKFPMSKGEKIIPKNKEEFFSYMKTHCCVFDIEIKNITANTITENYISAHKCRNKINVVENNGRVVSADRIVTSITEVDYKIIESFYDFDWSDVRIANFTIYKKGYLPTDLIKSILKLYSDKTTLKDVVGKEIEYMSAKENINAVYGMMVTDICKPIIEYMEHDWGVKNIDVEELIEKNNSSKKRFIFYPWGIYVTAYARRNLFTGIREFGEDYVYSDTDSIKVLNCEKHMGYINKYNNITIKKLKSACEYHGIEYSLCTPKTLDGKVKILGVWDFDGSYSKFKTIGAKRYIVKDSKTGKINITVAGVRKDIAVPYLLKKYGDDGIFEHFDNYLIVPSNYSGKNTFTYIDDEIRGYVVDYLGTECTFYEKSGAHLEKADFTMSMSDQYVDYLKGVRLLES